MNYSSIPDVETTLTNLVSQNDNLDHSYCYNYNQDQPYQQQQEEETQDQQQQQQEQQRRSLRYPGQTTTTTTKIRRRSLTVLTVSIWISCICFAMFASFHYIRRALLNYENDDEWKYYWNLTDPQLYRSHQQQPYANILMITHLLGGSLLMIFGPIQLLSWIRQYYLQIHRIIGRIYIIATMMTAFSIIIFVLLYRTSRKDIHEDIGNLILGCLIIFCSLQSYRYIYNKQIEQHKWWSYRLFAVVLAALLYRLYVVTYFALVRYTPWKGSQVIYESLFYLFSIPNLAIVQLYKWIIPPGGEGRTNTITITKTTEMAGLSSNNNKTTSSNEQKKITTNYHLFLWKVWLGKFLYSSILLNVITIFVLITTIIISIFDWIPSILGKNVGQASDVKEMDRHSTVQP